MVLSVQRQAVSVRPWVTAHRSTTDLGRRYGCGRGNFRPCRSVLETMNSADLPLRRNRLAIVGFAYRFPAYSAPETGSEDFWSSLVAGRNLVSTVHASRWSRERFVHPRRSEPGAAYTMAAGSLGD